MDNLPKLTAQQQDFLLHYFSNGKNAFKAYKNAYNCENMKDKTAYEEASKLLNNPKITPWVEYYRKNEQEVIVQELKYTAQEAFDEFQELKEVAIKSRDKYGNSNVNVALKAVECKAKLAGLFKDKLELSGASVVQMGEIKTRGEYLEFKIGENYGGNNTSRNT